MRCEDLLQVIQAARDESGWNPGPSDRLVPFPASQAACSPCWAGGCVISPPWDSSWKGHCSGGGEPLPLLPQWGLYVLQLWRLQQVTESCRGSVFSFLKGHTPSHTGHWIDNA